MKQHEIANFYESDILRSLIDNMPDFMYIKDTKSRFVIANKFLIENVRMKSLKDLIGKTDFDFYPENMAREFFQDEQKIMQTKVSLIQKQEEVLDKNDRKLVLSTTKVPWIDPGGKVLGIIGIGRDITNLKSFETELLQQTRNLQEINVVLEEKHEQINEQAEEMAAQAESLKALNNELHRINETKDKFISIIAHDLKNPFNAIINFSELLIIKNARKPKDMEMIHIINSSSKMAYSLLENLLYWGKSQNSSIPFHPAFLNMTDMINEATDFHQVSSKLKNIDIIYEAGENPLVLADQNMVTTILRNLLSNAIKFTPKKGKITITCYSAKNFINTEITDNGVGISKEQMLKLFQPDMEATKGTSGESGTGLGLVLCKEFAIKNGGDIFVKSEPGKGSSFILSLPLPTND